MLELFAERGDLLADVTLAFCKALVLKERQPVLNPGQPLIEDGSENLLADLEIRRVIVLGYQRQVLVVEQGKEG